MRKPVFLLLFLLLPLLAPAADLGEVRVSVPDRTPSERDVALAAGLEKVLMRLSGEAQPRALPGADSLFTQPTRYLQRYEYELAADQPPLAQGEQVPPMLAGQGAEADAAQGGGELTLVMRFDVDSLVDRMLALGMPVWSTRRPGVLAWVVLQRPGFGEILGATSSDPLARSVTDQARDRGLLLTLPEMDAQDQGVISAADVRGRFDRVLEQASSRYRQPLTLTAVLYSGNPVQGRWRLLDQGSERASGEFAAPSEEEAVARVLQAVTEVQVADYTVSAGAASDRLLQVDGIARLPQWQDLMTYLQGLEGMDAVQLMRTSGERVTVLLRFSGDTAQLARLLAVNRHLQPCQDIIGVGAAVAAPKTVQTGSEVDVPAPELALPSYCWQP